MQTSSIVDCSAPPNKPDNISWTDIALEIFDYVKKTEKPDIQHIQTEYKLFYGSFPEVVNFMLSGRVFSKKAFELTVKKKESMPRKPEYFWQLQAFYARELYKARTPHWKPNIAKEIYKNTYENYRKEFDKVIAERDRIEAERTEREKAYAAERRRELKEFLSAQVTTLPV